MVIAPPVYDMGETRTVLDLFAGLGGFSQAFAESDKWEVVTVDIEERFEPDIVADVMDLRPADLPDADVVLASPPCQAWSPANNMNGSSEIPAKEIALVYHTLGLIKSLRPDFWFLENPKGRLRTEIGTPTATVTYCQYGEEHMKPTDLWGEHPPMTYRRCSYGDSCHINTREGTNAMSYEAGKRSAAERSKVPYELSEAIRDAIETEYESPSPTQTELTEVIQ